MNVELAFVDKQYMNRSQFILPKLQAESCPTKFPTSWKKLFGIAGPVLPLSLILLKKIHKHNKEHKAFLLVELRIAIQKYS
jgi:hypothetical protein